MKISRVCGNIARVGTTAVLAAVVATPAWAGPRTEAFTPPPLGSSPSDQRAEYHDGNVTTCDQVSGVPAGDIQVGAQGDTAAQDAYVAGTTQDGTKVEVAITPAGQAAGVVVDAVVVKGGDGYNVYRDPYVPPTLPPNQDYISPLNGGGNVPDISHWFVCYHLGSTPGGTKHAVLGKVVIPPPGVPADTLPTSFTVTVTCTGLAPFDVTFGAGGGVVIAGQDKLDGIPDGTVCTVAENTAGMPAGSQVRYSPASAATTGVTVGSGPVVAVVVNDFSGVDVKTTSMRVTKAVDAPAGTGVADTFTWGVACKDGNGDPTGNIGGKPNPQTVTVPAGGSVLVEDIAVGANCAVAEDPTSLPAGWTATYTVNGAQPTTTLPVFTVDDAKTVEVTITNTYTAAPQPANLPNTGARVDNTLLWAGGLLLSGTLLIGVARRRKRTTS